MNQKDAEILGKIMEIARLKKEIVQAIVPEKTYRHLEVIGNEFKAMVVDLISDSVCDCDCKCKAEECKTANCDGSDDNSADCKPSESERSSKSMHKQTSKIKKVDID